MVIWTFSGSFMNRLTIKILVSVLDTHHFLWLLLKVIWMYADTCWICVHLPSVVLEHGDASARPGACVHACLAVCMHVAVQRSRNQNSGKSQKEVCRTPIRLWRPGMPNRYTEYLILPNSWTQSRFKTTLGKESAPEGYAKQGIPNTYAEKLLLEVRLLYQH